MRFYKPVLCTAALFCGLCVSSTAMAADPKPYIEIGAALSDGGFNDEALHVSGIARAGVEVTSWAAFEVEGLIGLEDSEITRSNGDVRQVGLDSQIGGFLRLGIPIDKQFLPYIKLGYGTAKTTSKRERDRDGTVTTEEREDSFSGGAFGIGVQGFFGETRQNGIRLDFTALIAEGDEEEFLDLFDGTSSVNLTYVRRF